MIYRDRFRGRAAIVTGGAAGIGLGVAQRLIAEGAACCLWDQDADALGIAAHQIGAAAVQVVDVADVEQVDAAMSASLAGLGGRLDILVAGAGITGPNATVRDYPIQAWRRVIDVNLHGVFHCNRAAVPAMERRGYGRIINVASVAGKEGNPNAAAYSASKAGVIGLTKSLGKELARTDIRVNCVALAAVRTAIFDQMSQEHVDFMLSKIPMGRFGAIDEVTALVCWLTSDEASFSTGVVFDISGGRAT